jgi:hypothetical protein
VDFSKDLWDAANNRHLTTAQALKRAQLTVETALKIEDHDS